MTRLLPAILCCLMRVAPAQQPACAQLDSREIHGKDLAMAFAAFAALPEDLPLGPMPLAGSARIFHIPELRSLASRYSIPLGPEREVCFEWPMEPLDPVAVQAAMRAAMPGVNPRIELVEVSGYHAPRGAIEFPLVSLTKPGSAASPAPLLWRGSVVYGGGLQFAVWARVRISADCNRLVAVQPLKPGAPISTDQLRIETVQAFPDPDRCMASAADVAGLSPLRPISTGAEVRRSALALPYDVERGQAVQVTVTSGAARLALMAKAETNGRNGDLIAVRNPGNNRIFQARVSGKARAMVAADLPGGF